ncbi:sulfatase [Chthonobacter albigriseus]|uniref:sulfatase n=1 Tax=Chthonobacter albigriseus TaxID=1683161 RepID=UPI0015EF8D73|nr:sulfatase [Chthonobacter albigriseus]
MGGSGSGGDTTANRRTGFALSLLAIVVVFAILVAPNELDRITPAAFLRIPLEAVVLAILYGVLPFRAARVLAAFAGVALGLVAILKIADMGSFPAFARPFDPVLDWHLLDAAMNLLTGAIGRTGAVAAAAGAALLAVAVLAAAVWSSLRMQAAVARHRTVALPAAVVAAVAWLGLAAAAVEIRPRVPVASSDGAVFAANRLDRVRVSLADARTFQEEAAVDAFRDTPADRLLTALTGKDVLVVFVESYGRDAVENPEFAPAVGAVLDEGDIRLRAAGLGVRSAYLTSPTVGGQSWLAHGTLLSGLWIDNQQRYRTLVGSDRMTLNAAFRKAGWRTVAVMPAISMAWPEGDFFGYDRAYTLANLGYRGKPFNWVTMPDQYTLSAFERFERVAPDRKPVMAEIALISSHAPWTPIPEVIDWAEVGDGTVFNEMASAGDPPDVVWRDPARVRTQFRLSIEYALKNLVSYLETFGDDRLVVVVLGDHQPAPLVTGDGATRDVPVSVIARDPAVLARLDGWSWHPGLRPPPGAPVWRMDHFRDRFLQAFSPEAAGP